jgi:hypothetical protein
VADDIVAQLRAFDDGRVSTHYEGCWARHPICALHRAADEIEWLQEELKEAAVAKQIMSANDNTRHKSTNGDIINELAYYITNEDRMPSGLVRTVIEEIEWLREQARAWQATAAGLAEDLSNAEDEAECMQAAGNDLALGIRVGRWDDALKAWEKVCRA